MGGSSKTSTTSSAPANPQVTPTLNKLLGGISKAYDKGPSVFNQPLYAGVGSNTTGSWASALNAAKNPAFASSINGAITDFGDVAAGNRFGMNDPGYAALRNKLMDDTLTNVNSSFNNSGLFGSDSNMRAAGEGVGNALAALDYGNFQNDITRQQQAAQMLPGLFGAAQLPAGVQAQVGAAQDADKQAQLLGNYDLFERKNNADTDLLAKLSSILAGTAGQGGTTTTQTTPTTPWWQSAIGLGIGLL